MKLCRPALFLLVLFFLPLCLRAQWEQDRDERFRSIFSVYSFASYISWRPMPGTFSVRFPYTLTDRATGASTTHNFSAEKTNLAGNGKWANTGIGVELGKGHVSVEGALGFYFHQWSDNIYFGINYRFILKRLPQWTNRYEFASIKFPGKRLISGLADFPVKISLGVYYYQPLYELGKISIGNQQFLAAGQTMQSIDSGSVGNTGEVTVFFHQNIIALTPNFTIGYRPVNGRIDLSFRVSPFISFAQRGGLRFYLRNSGAVEWAPEGGLALESVIPLNTYSVVAQMNGERLQATPFQFRCVMYTLRIGIRLF
jgi:hypothetical protein